MIIFISGGARSGKSSYAEKIALEMHEKTKQQKLVDNSLSPRLYYLATAEALDQEMAERIKRHQEQRNLNRKTTLSWETIEEPYDITHVLRSCQDGDVVLIDCVTVWLNNVMFRLKQPIELIQKEVESWINTARDQRLELIIVSNDLNEGMPSSYCVVQQYIKGLQWIHRLMVTEADQAIQVIAGIPFNWKDKRKC